jgi:predicted acetyltransferase
LGDRTVRPTIRTAFKVSPITDATGPSARLDPAPLELKPALRRLLTDYLVEFAAMEGVPPELGPDGHAPYRYFEDYWTDPSRVPFAIWLGSELAGFCLLRDTGERWQVAEFFVAPIHRRRGVAAAAVDAAKRYCRADGRHRLLEASTLRFNTHAYAFWSSQGFVTESETPRRLINLFDLAR